MSHAEDLLVAMEWDTKSYATAQRMIRAITEASFSQMGIVVEDAALAKATRPALETLIAKMRPKMVEILNTLDDREAADTLAFLRSPVGKRWIAISRVFEDIGTVAGNDPEVQQMMIAGLQQAVAVATDTKSRN